MVEAYQIVRPDGFKLFMIVVICKVCNDKNIVIRHIVAHHADFRITAFVVVIFPLEADITVFNLLKNLCLFDFMVSPKLSPDKSQGVIGKMHLISDPK